MIRQAFKDLGRLREIASVAIRHGFGGLLERTHLWEMLGRKEKTAERPESQRESTARRFRLFLSELGPTFVKLGQILSTRPDLLPREFIQELSLLQDAVPPEPMDHVLRQIEQSLGRPAGELFSSIEESPLASASIAQVHRARLPSGEDVVVKIQRPDMAQRIRADLDLLYYIARILEAVVEETGVYTPTGVIEEFDAAVHEELDFLNEARNLRDFGRIAAKRQDFVVPRVFDELTSRTVLTMDFVKGEKISAIDLERHDREAMAKRIVEGAFRQLFEDGIFHGDPHPGNILVLENDRLALLDFGVVGHLTKSMQETLILLVLAVSLKDAETVARLLYRVALPDQRANLSAFRSDIQRLLDIHLTRDATLGRLDVRTIVPELLNLAVRYHIRIPKEYAILSRASVALEGLLRWLYPQLNIGQVVMPYAKELLIGRWESTGLGVTGMRALLRLQTFAADVPMQLSQILLDLETGKLMVNVAGAPIERLARDVRGLGLAIFTGLIACGLTIGALLSFSRLDRTVHGIPLLGALAAIAVGILSGAVITWSLASGKHWKFSIARWLERRQTRSR